MLHEATHFVEAFSKSDLPVWSK